MSTESFHPIATTNTYVTVIIPIAVPKPYTYYVPEELVQNIKFGVRVEVQFGKSKLYSALVMKVHDEAPKEYKPKPIISIIDHAPIIFPTQIKLWRWMSKYYACTLGEIMNAALPSGMKLASETRVVLSPLLMKITMALMIKNSL